MLTIAPPWLVSSAGTRSDVHDCPELRVICERRDHKSPHVVSLAPLEHDDSPAHTVSPPPLVLGVNKQQIFPVYLGSSQGRMDRFRGRPPLLVHAQHAYEWSVWLEKLVTNKIPP